MDGGAMGWAFYFTRSTLYGEGPVWRPIGLYAYRRAALGAFNAAPVSVDTTADLNAARAFAKARR
jgi:3-deoxy-manno-octulosonate cytidylyltransferase (CMP-KDO synthetase)